MIYPMLRPFILLFLLALPLSAVFAQPAARSDQYTSAADSDPEAKRLLEAIRKKYDGYTTMSAEFRLAIALPEQPVEEQRGSISRQGDNVRFRLGNQEGILNDRAAYVILHGSKEVQINDLPEPGELTGVLTPQTLFSFYEGDNYVLSVIGDERYAGKTYRAIELKPIDRNNSDFTKLRILADARAKEIATVKAFTRDGSNYTFFLDKTVANPTLPATTFRFDAKAFPGYHVEDLRY